MEDDAGDISTAPPYTRWHRLFAARSLRSRRMVSSDVENSVARTVAFTWPSRLRRSRMRLCRSAGRNVFVCQNLKRATPCTESCSTMRVLSNDNHLRSFLGTPHETEIYVVRRETGKE
jgi:hypothetical protein